MQRGTGPTANKFWKTLGTRSFVLEVGAAPHQYTIERLKSSPPEDFTKAEVAEVIAAYEPPEGEKEDAAPPDAKRGPGRPRKVDRTIDPAPEVYPPRAE